MSQFVAHINKNGEIQTLETHLSEAGEICSAFASKIGLANVGLLLGLLHDFGKYSQKFQNYIKSAEGLINQEDEQWVDAKKKKGTIDHSSAGAIYVFNALSKLARNKGYGELVGQIMALCIASHHSGLIDVISLDNVKTFHKRMLKPEEDTYFEECVGAAPSAFLSSVDSLIDTELVKSVIMLTRRFNEDFGPSQDCKSSGQVAPSHKSEKHPPLQPYFHLGFLTRFLFSCLIDADRLNSAEFEEPERKQVRRNNAGPVDWERATKALENKLQEFGGSEHYVNQIRAEIADNCLEKAIQAQGLYTLTVPTGGGKTYASLRYALNHAKKHNLDRIIYVIPFTSIIDQNADAIRKAFKSDPELQSWVLEHHSNLEPEVQTWHSKLASENWDSPIVLTTSVQLLEAMFGGGTRNVRRLHQLANSVVIFDEIQTLPIKCIHLFCNGLNFLTQYCKTTAVLCTATQPGLNALKRPEKGGLKLTSENELIGDYQRYYKDLQRVEVENLCKHEGWQAQEISDLAIQQLHEKKSCLVIVNTKNWAKELYTLCSESVNKEAIFHLSTNQYPAHRKSILDDIRERLDNDLPVLCISTQLIEAGVDVDFASVVRFLAGLDSIAQAAGRCNRNGNLKDEHDNPKRAKVYIVNPFKETTDLLTDIEVGKEKARSILNAGYSDLLSPEAISQYFKEYYYNRSDEMTYRLEKPYQDESVLDLISQRAECETPGRRDSTKIWLMRHAFMEAGKQFEVISAPTQSLIIEHGRGKKLIAELLSVAKEFDAKAFYDLLKEAQQYSVNVFPHVWRQLGEENAIVEIQGEGIYYLTERYYNDAFGLSTEPEGSMSLNVL